jgi:hypothetical protein
LVRGSIKEKLQWIFRLYDISDDGKLTKQVCYINVISIDFDILIFQTFETLLRSLYDLLGPNNCIHQPVSDDTVEKHSALLFEVNYFSLFHYINFH